jgi:hypothetical protein
LLAVGLPCLWVHRRVRPTFTVLVSVAIACGIAFICGFYAFEMRYFLMLVPLAAISLAGAIVRAWEEAPSGWIGTAMRSIALVAAVGIVISSGAVAARIGKQRPSVLDNRRLCAATVDWVRRNVPPDAVILATNPSWVSWATERFTVKTPSGSADDLRRIAQHYDVRWGFFVLGRGRRAEAFNAWLYRDPTQMRANCRFAERGCVVCELQWPPRPVVPSDPRTL